MKRINFILISLWLAATLGASFAYAGNTGKIMGRVIDNASGEPLMAVNIIIDGTTMGAASNEQGHYFIHNILPGSYVLRARMMGYKNMEVRNVKVFSDLTTEVDFQLELSIIEGEVVTLSDLFRFDQTGIDQSGKVQGEMKATGLRPVFTPKLEVVGFHLGAEVFGAI